MKSPGPGDALIVVDVQNDFLPGGALAVPRGNEVIRPLNRLIRRWSAQGQVLVFTRDWHPPDHMSFRPQGGPWPPHCVARTLGAQFPSSLHVPRNARIVSKAKEPGSEAYSGFQDTNLAQLLRKAGVSRVFIGGLATDYCVRETGKDARAAGLDTVVLTDAVRAVDVQAGDGERALAELEAAGVVLATSDAVIEELETGR
jgi:nicotinamidase/pyrazinamidase